MLFLFFKSDDFTGTYVLLSESVDKSLAKYARGVNSTHILCIGGMELVFSSINPVILIHF